MRLRYAAASPFVRKVMVALHETGMIDQVTIEDGATTPVDPNAGNLAANPVGKIPSLVLDDGTALHDSRVITRWIDAQSGGRLYPTGDALWPALVTEATADAVMEAGIAVVYEARLRPEPMRFKPWTDAQRAKIASAMDAFETAPERLDGEMHMGRLALACALGYVDFRLTDWDWRETRPKLAAWAEAAFARPSLAATTPR